MSSLKSIEAARRGVGEADRAVAEHSAAVLAQLLNQHPHPAQLLLHVNNANLTEQDRKLLRDRAREMTVGLPVQTARGTFLGPARRFSAIRWNRLRWFLQRNTVLMLCSITSSAFILTVLICGAMNTPGEGWQRYRVTSGKITFLTATSSSPGMLSVGGALLLKVAMDGTRTVIQSVQVFDRSCLCWVTARAFVAEDGRALPMSQFPEFAPPAFTANVDASW